MNRLKIPWVLLLALILPCIATGNPKDTASLHSRLVGGTWSRHLDDKRFLANGTYKSSDRDPHAPSHGKWRLDGTTLTMTEGGETTKHRIISITATDLDMTFGDGSKGLHYRRFSE